MRFRTLRALLLLLIVALSVVGYGYGPVRAENFPTRMVRVVLPFPAGAAADIIARLLAENLSAQWGQPVIVENRVGANGNIGSEYVARSQPDGYTILFATSPIYTTAKLLYPNLSFDPDTDLKPVMLTAMTPNVILVSSKTQIHTLQELIAYARQNPGQVTYASQGVGSTGQLTSAYFAQLAKLDLRHIPYRGAAPALTDVIAGHVTMSANGLSSLLGIEGIRVLVVASAKRSAAMPDVPTAAEAGLPDLKSESWYGVTVPAQTPDAIVKIIHDGMAKAFNEPDVRKKLTERGAEIIASTPEEFTNYKRADTQRWKRVIESLNMKPE